jgi:hypothetical protein
MIAIDCHRDDCAVSPQSTTLCRLPCRLPTSGEQIIRVQLYPLTQHKWTDSFALFTGFQVSFQNARLLKTS